MAASSSNWRARPDAGLIPVVNTSSANQEGQNSDIPLWNRRESAAKAATVSVAEIRGQDDARTLQAVDEGRRLYVGNLPYTVGTKEIEDLFINHCYEIEHINMSIDPFTGRNPSYCFVELPSKNSAEGAMEELTGKYVLGRPVKIGPCKASRSKKRARQSDDAPGYRDKAYGRSSIQPSTRVRKPDQFEPPFQRWTRDDAADHWKGYNEEGRRLWVGGLPRMADHASVNQGVRELFQGFSIEAISKVVIPKNRGFGHPDAWDHRYLFVDFPTAKEARQAAEATNGRRAWGVKVYVNVAKPVTSGKALEAKRRLID